MKLVEHKTCKGMFYLQWPDGSLSDDFYNKIRAKWYQRNLQAQIDYKTFAEAPTEAVGAFK